MVGKIDRLAIGDLIVVWVAQFRISLFNGFLSLLKHHPSHAVFVSEEAGQSIERLQSVGRSAFHSQFGHLPIQLVSRGLDCCAPLRLAVNVLFSGISFLLSHDKEDSETSEGVIVDFAVQFPLTFMLVVDDHTKVFFSNEDDGLTS